MFSLLFLAVTSFALSLALTPGIRDLFNRLGVVDVPDGARKFHDHPIPRAGGIAIVLSFGLSTSLLLLTPSQGGRIILQAPPLIGKLMPAAALIFFVGLLDDLIRLKPWHKLAGQVAAALLAYSAGVRVLGMGGVEFSPWWTLPITVFWLVGCCNAINLIDGVDGLAAGVSFVATASMLVAAAIQHNAPLAFATVPLAGCLLGFLRYNFSPASVFLGDCGSLFVGFLLGCYGVLWSEKSTTVLGMTAPLIALSLPLADTGLAIVRRFLRGQPIFKGDRGHIHHRLLDLHLTPRKVALTLYGVCAIAALFSLCMAKEYFEVPVLLLFGVVAWLGVRRLGYVEFNTLARLIVQGSFRRLLSSQIALRDFEARAVAANTTEELWETLRSSYGEFGLSQIHMRLAGQTYFARLEAGGARGLWHAIIPFADGDFVELTRQIQSGRDDSAAAFADVILRTLETKRAIFVAPTAPVEPCYAVSRAASAGN
jgi:UDP-GlcNAc:undecaprenyl-phosphate/decaprenyl-phosphate GlcNAc-1-phosphate transferase